MSKQKKSLDPDSVELLTSVPYRGKHWIVSHLDGNHLLWYLSMGGSGICEIEAFGEIVQQSKVKTVVVLDARAVPRIKELFNQ